MTSETYLVFLGRAADLCYTELTLYLESHNHATYKRLTPSIVLVNDCSIDPYVLQSQLGGIVKIALIGSIIKSDDEASLFAAIEKQITPLLEQSTSKVPFSVIPFGDIGLPKKVLQAGLKSYIESLGRSARFIDGGIEGLTSVQLQTQKIINKGFELFIYKIDSQIYLATTVSFQDFGLWSKRDYGRPRFDAKRGMLPPKVARMMVTIAASLYQLHNKKPPETVLDPFCGEGTILAEAIAQNMTVFGSDIDDKAVMDTKENISWLIKKSGLVDSAKNLLGQIFQSDVSNVPNSLKQSIDLLVAEPFLGPNTGNPLFKAQVNQARQQFSQLFEHVMQTAAKMQKPGGIIGMVVPSTKVEGRDELLLAQRFLDTRENFGYTPLVGPLVYARPGANIVRNIYFFKKG